MEIPDGPRAAEILTATLAPRPFVVAIFRNGSTVVGAGQPGSDVDFTVILRRKSDRAKTLALLRGRLEYLGLDHGVPTFRGRRRIGVVLLARSTVEGILRSLYRTPESLLELQGVVQHKIVEAAAVHDPRGVLPRYQRRATAYPARIQRAVFAKAIRSLEVAYRDWGTRNEFHFAASLPPILEAICVALYARNRRLFMVPGKRLHRDLRTLRPDLEEDLRGLVRSGGSARSRREGREILGGIVDRLRTGFPPLESRRGDYRKSRSPVARVRGA